MMGYPQPPILSLLLLLLLLLLLFLPFLLQLLHILLLLPPRIPNLPLSASAGASAQDLGLELVGLSAISPSRHKTLAIFFLLYKIIFLNVSYATNRAKLWENVEDYAARIGM